MMKSKSTTSPHRPGFLLGAFPLILTALALAGTVAAPAKDGQTATAMSQTANRLLASYDAAQNKMAAFPFDHKSRQTWHFFPNWSDRTGIALNQLSETQRTATKELLNLLLSSEAFQEQENIRLIHGLKKDLAAPNNPMHAYHLAIFGKPSINRTWGWSYEGHHLSLSCTLVDGRHFALTPSFWGAAPVRITKGDHRGLEVFEKERAMGMAFVNALSTNQKKQAGLKKGIGPGATTKLNRQSYLPQFGIPFSELNPSQQKELLSLVRVFAGKYRPDIIKQLNERKMITDTASMTFAYLSDSPKYIRHYRIQTKEYLIEFDNRGGNHVHSAWRDFEGDFGRDLISEHLKKEH
jgi:hypothetical protein